MPFFFCCSPISRVTPRPSIIDIWTGLISEGNIARKATVKYIHSNYPVPIPSVLINPCLLSHLYIPYLSNPAIQLPVDTIIGHQWILQNKLIRLAVVLGGQEHEPTTSRFAVGIHTIARRDTNRISRPCSQSLNPFLVFFEIRFHFREGPFELFCFDKPGFSF